MDQGRSGRYDLRRLRLAAQRAVRQIPEQSTTPERGYFFCRSAVGRFIFLPPRCRFIFPVRQIALSPVHFPGTVDSPVAGSFFRCDRLPVSGLSLPVRVVYLSRCGWFTSPGAGGLPLPVRVVYLFRYGGWIAQVQPPTLLPAWHSLCSAYTASI